MASCSRKKKKKKKNEPFLFEEELPRFFKIILPPDSISQPKLGIPPKFVQIYGDHLSSPVTLKVPNGGIKWKVEIVKSDGEIWLQNGWREFAEYYSVVEGSFLVFEFLKTNSEFNVIIFDKTASEINYPVHLDQQQVPQDPHTNNAKESIEKESRSNKELKVSFSNRRDAKETSDEITSTNLSFRVKISSASLRSSVVYVPGSFLKNIKQELKYAKLKVNNRCWLVKLIIRRKSCRGQLSAGWSAFARENSLKSGDVCIFQLINNTDQTLLINVSIIRDLGTNREVERLVPKVEETTIDIPDEVLGQFSSSRKRKEKSTLSSSYQPHKKAKKVDNFTKKTEKEANKENKGLAYQKQMVNKILPKKKPYLTLKEKTLDENPKFWIAIRPSHVHHRWSKLDIPVGFARKYMKRNDGYTVLNVLNGKTWSVKYCRRRSCGLTRTKLTHSDWKKFVQGNHLRVGDTCTFELIDPKNSIFRVIISERRVASSLGKSKQSMVKECICLGKPQSSNPLEAAKKYTTVNPFFQVVMARSHLGGGGISVNVPHKFIKNLVSATRIAQLQVDNRIWPVKLITYPHYAQKSAFSAGWIRFVRANSLKVGDVCFFELIDTQNLVVKVSIYRQ